MKLIDIYRTVLEYGGFTSDENGYVFSNLAKKDKINAFVNKAQIVLPLPNHLKIHDPENKIFFHPLKEEALKGESIILRKYKESLNIRLNISFSILIHSLLIISASPKCHSKFTPEQMELLSAVKECNEKASDSFHQIILAAIKESSESFFVNIYLKRGGVVNGEKHSVAGITNFSFYSKLLADTFKTQRKADKTIYTEVINFIFPELEGSLEAYNHFSDSSVAPYLDALMMTSLKVTSRLNELFELYRSFIETLTPYDNVDDYMFDLSFVDYFEGLEQLGSEIRKIPLQFGNEGVNEDKGSTLAPVPVQTQQPYVPPQPYQPVAPYGYQQPVQQQPPQLVITDQGLDFRSVLASMSPQQRQASDYNNAFVNHNHQQFQQQQFISEADRRPSWAGGGGNQYYNNQPSYPNYGGNGNNWNNGRGGGI